MSRRTVAARLTRTAPGRARDPPGTAGRPDTTFGTTNDDVLAQLDPSFRGKDVVRTIRAIDWPQ
ncbi:hypothetical protein [Streptomyces sp. NRRL F-5123]|uniref:hypothetical protein n=1 Tax=Streptomyces sp. NRRL F-5123 TaxID=1463856 RepID=UPI0004E17882|nr:hypothetical protein [Streptomyces sp. NRRL F-5123]